MKLSDLTIDSKTIEQGDWVSDIPDLPGLRLRVRGLGNVDYRIRQSQLIRALPYDQRAAGLDRVLPELLSETILLGWDGITADDGTPLPYSPELARDLLNNPDYQPLRDATFWAANEVASRRKAVQDDAIKN